MMSQIRPYVYVNNDYGYPIMSANSTMIARTMSYAAVTFMVSSLYGGKKSEKHNSGQLKLAYSFLDDDKYVVAFEYPVKMPENEYTLRLGASDSSEQKGRTYYIDVAIFEPSLYYEKGELYPVAFLEVDRYKGQKKSISHMKFRDRAIMLFWNTPIIRFDIESLTSRTKSPLHLDSIGIRNKIVDALASWHTERGNYIIRSTRD